MEAKLQAHPGDICGAPGFLDVFDVTCVFAQYKNLSKLILRYFSDSEGLVAKESTEHPCCHCHFQFQARVKIANEGVNGWITGPVGADVATWNGRFRMASEFGGRATLLFNASVFLV